MFADFKAIEYRMLAFYLNSIGYPEMAQEFRAGLDPHRQKAIQLLGKTDPTDEERSFGKTFNFMTIYGGGVGKIAEMTKGIELPKGMTPKKLYEEFHRLNPGIRRLSWAQPTWPDPDWVPGRIEEKLRMRGYITTLWGRELHPVGHRALNYLIQGCSADLLRASMVRVHDELDGRRSHLVLPVHDELIVDVAADDLEFVVAILRENMTDMRITKVVPIDVDIEITSTTWADKETYGDA